MPRARSLPCFRTDSPTLDAARIDTRAPSAVVSSCITIASAPSGMTAPVKMRIATPGAIDDGAAPPVFRLATYREHDGRARRRAVHIRRANRVSVHAAVVEGRQIEAGLKVLCEVASKRVREVEPLGANRCERRHHLVESLLDAFHEATLTQRRNVRPDLLARGCCGLAARRAEIVAFCQRRTAWTKLRRERMMR